VSVPPKVTLCSVECVQSQLSGTQLSRDLIGRLAIYPEAY